MPEHPVVSVVMSVYNGERYLREAIESILSQTFTDFEFLIIDDGSTDNSADIIRAYQNHDPRIRLVQNDANIGLTRSLNKGLDLARGTYIARMDADDISLPERFARHVAFMDAHPEIGICGTWAEFFGVTPGGIWRNATDPDEIKSRLFFGQALTHPSVMLRRSTIQSANLYYNSDYVRSQDYELWARASRHVRISNVPEVLLRYRLHPRQIGTTHFHEQVAMNKRIHLMQLMNLGIEPTSQELDFHEAVIQVSIEPSNPVLQQAEEWLCKLWQANTKTQAYPEPFFSTILSDRWMFLCSYSTRWDNSAWWAYTRSPLSRLAGWKYYLLRTVKIGVKCLIYYSTHFQFSNNHRSLQ
jgi:hypothetical protein